MFHFILLIEPLKFGISVF